MNFGSVPGRVALGILLTPCHASILYMAIVVISNRTDLGTVYTMSNFDSGFWRCVMFHSVYSIICVFGYLLPMHVYDSFVD